MEIADGFNTGGGGGGLGTGGGLAAVVQAAPATATSTTATATTPAITTHVRKPRVTKPRANGSAAAAAAPDDNHRTITITLPKETLAWYEQQAAAAPFEPSVQKFVAWELREMAKARQAAANSTLQQSQ